MPMKDGKWIDNLRTTNDLELEDQSDYVKAIGTLLKTVKKLEADIKVNRRTQEDIETLLKMQIAMVEKENQDLRGALVLQELLKDGSKKKTYIINGD